MWLALRDFYANSWRLVVVNAALGTVLVLAALATLAEPLAIVFVIATGPVIAALVHCAVTLVRTGDLSLADALAGLRLHWLRGLELAGAGAVLAALGVLEGEVAGAHESHRAVDDSREHWPRRYDEDLVAIVVGEVERPRGGVERHA